MAARKEISSQPCGTRRLRSVSPVVECDRGEVRPQDAQLLEFLVRTSLYQ